jgi:uncharacterized membrane protein
VTSPDGAPIYMDATITPNRSLGEGGRNVVIAALCIGCAFISAFLFVLGAWPAPIFLGLDVVAVWWAFRVAARNAERRERVRVSAETVVVSREEKTVWTSKTAFTGVDVERAGEHDARVRVTLSGRRLTVAAALSPDERIAFAEALRMAIARARAERYPA